jgi:hypothetical protein
MKSKTGNPAVPPSSAKEETARAASDAVLVPTGFRPAVGARISAQGDDGVITPRPAITPPSGYRFAQFVKAVPFAAVNGTTDGAITARVGAPIVSSAAVVAEVTESPELGGCLVVSLAPDARTGVIQRVLVPFSNVLGAVRV